MVERDASGMIVDKVVGIVGRLRMHMKEQLPLGPTRARMTIREQRLRLQKMEPEAKQAMVEEMGSDAWNTLMRELYNGA